MKYMDVQMSLFPNYFIRISVFNTLEFFFFFSFKFPSIKYFNEYFQLLAKNTIKTVSHWQHFF